MSTNHINKVTGRPCRIEVDLMQEISALSTTVNVSESLDFKQRGFIGKTDGPSRTR